ncbi:acyltransferase family protein [Sinosporangium siamense]|uniref:Membrane protein n=1 Tax=Sinosporangium siamense TaxID=1367973 RepID=A0A919V599_9ACTN|nr:acyltransferase family protein [Sinosporangium siamense]GII92775.1 membrane protein [Sinosporangium siamense]
MANRTWVGISLDRHLPALDGLRALSVLLVILYHLEAPWLPGGFLGVDVFFVLSGFLITSLLMAEIRATGRLDVLAFWARRARRLLPAVAVLLGVLTVYAATRPPPAQTPLRGDLLSAATYVANWHFVLEGRSYSAEFQAPSPLRHFWSLAVEEQFYLVFPLLLSLGLAVLAGRSRRRIGWALIVMGIAASTVVLGVLYEGADPSRAYYGTDARAHELLIGVALAVFLGRRRAPHMRRAAPMLAWTGLVTVVASAFLIDDRAPFYYLGGSALVSLGAAALIAGVALTQGAVREGTEAGVVVKALSWRPVSGIGRISYSLYLWHWPVIAILSTESIGLAGPTLVALQSLVMLCAAAGSYFLVERPILTRSWPASRIAAPALAVASSLFLASAAVAATWRAAPVPDYVRQRDGLVLHKDAVPGAPVIGLVGDSIAVSLQEGLAQESARRGHTLVSAARPGCGVGSAILLDEKGFPFSIARTCAERTPFLQEQLITRFDPRVVIWHSARDRTDMQVSGRTLKAGSPEWIRHRFTDWNATLRRLSRAGARVVVLLPAWGAGASTRRDCGGEFHFEPARCGAASVSTEHLRRLYIEWAARHTGEVEVVDLAQVTCPNGMPCPATLSGVRLREDDVHFSREGAALLAPAVLGRILSAR